MTTADETGQFFDQVFVLNVVEVPTALTLTTTSVAPGMAIGTVVGQFSTTEGGTGHTYTYSLVTGDSSTNNSSFTITGNQLVTASRF